MKKIMTFFVLALIVACSKDSGGSSSNAMTMKIDNVAVTASTVHATLDQNILNIHGIWDNKKRIDLRIVNYDGRTGDFVIDYVSNVNIGANYALDYASSDLNLRYYAESGVIQIDEITDSSIRGRFYFVAKNLGTGANLNITEGVFHSPLAR